jgi:2,3-dihydroxybiphenyl 1,2-dioxygenase
MDIRALGYIGYYSPNAAEWASWGPEILGFSTAPPVTETPFHKVSALTHGAAKVEGATYLRMDDRMWRIAIYPGERDELAFVGWELADRIAFQEALAELKLAGVPFEVAKDNEALERGVQGMAWFHDPAGFRHEIYWSGYYFEDSFTPGRFPMKQGFRVGQLGIGHVVVMVPKFTEELDNFATKVLGMRLYAGGTSIPLSGGDGGRVRTEMYRGRHNLRSHNFVYMEKAGYHGLHHIFIEYDELDDLGRSYDLTQKKSKYPLIMTIGRHQADTFLSFYVQSPSKFVFEVAWNSKLIDDKSFVQERPLHSFVWGLDMVGPLLMDHLKIDPAREAGSAKQTAAKPTAWPRKAAGS